MGVPVSEMVETVARGLCRREEVTAYGERDWREGELQQRVDSYWRYHVPAARAAIEAMRELTEAMRAVQDDVVYLGDLWPRMIDAALSA